MLSGLGIRIGVQTSTEDERADIYVRVCRGSGTVSRWSGRISKKSKSGPTYNIHPDPLAAINENVSSSTCGTPDWDS